MKPRCISLMIAVAIMAIALASPATALPKMLLPEEEYDFGFVPQDSKVSHVFWIKSVGDDSLIIISVKPGCSCTQAPLAKKELAADDSTELEIIFSTGKNIGKTTKRPMITTNEGPPSRNVIISCDVVRAPDSTYPLIIKPFRLFVSKADTIEIDEAKFTIQNVSDQDLGIEVVSEPYGYFQLTLPKNIAPGQTTECKLKVNREYLAEPFEKSITLELTDASKTRFTIPVIRRLIGRQNAGAVSQPQGQTLPADGKH
ncbi:MAG: DUF1573 domain-containing protein [candidate division Zixibacteria bacterium]|nr:DUF1573 domain-containing protein [candidate division Zixibacteria bacterium]